MSRVIPHSINYKLIKKIDGVGTGILYISALLVVGTFVINKLYLGNKDSFANVISRVMAILALAYFIIDVVQNYFFHSAEVIRKNDFIDNSLNTKISDKNSVGYFTNEDIAPSIYKLGVNCFENSFFTKSVAQKMISEAVLQVVRVCKI
ncbi:MAG: hypothetical protein WKF85_15625, partial [Chitinophagaceae bacterium]